MAQATLFQFSLCPFCHKVKAGLELKNIAYDTVEVSPRSKSELPELPEDAPKKVPVFQYGEEVLWDSTVILKYLDSIPGDSLNLLPEEEAAKAEALRIEEWVDDSFTQVLPTVLYGSWKDAWRAALGFEEADDRVVVYQLYHMLNHLNLFGGSYLGGVMELADRLS